MEQNKNRYSKPKFTKLEIVFLILAGVFLILAIVDKVVKGSAADHFGPSDVYESNYVLQSYDGQTAIVPQSYIDIDGVRYRLYAMNYVNDRFYPVYVSDEYDYIFTDLESYRTSITYYTSNSEGGFVGSFITDQGISGLDYFIIRGMVWNIRLLSSSVSVPVGSKGISYAPITEWQFSAPSILYWEVGSGTNISYYALSSSDLTFDIDDQVIQLKSGVTYNLVSWDSELQDWDFVSSSPTQNYMDSLPISNVIRLKGPRFGINIDKDDYLDFDISYFHDDVPATPTPTSVPSNSDEEYFFLDLSGYGKVCFTFTCSDFNKPVEQDLDNNNMLSGIMEEFNTGQVFENGPIFIKLINGKGASLYFSGSDVSIGNWYFLGDTIVDYDLAYIKEHYVAHTGSPIQLYDYTLYVSSGSVVGLNCIYFQYGYSGSYQTFFIDGGSFNVINLQEYVGFPYPFVVNQYSNNRPMYYVYKYGLNSEDNENPNPSPIPTATPSPSPSPTTPPYVIVITDPIPTPIDWIDYQDPGYPKLKPGDLSSGFDDFEGQFSGGKGLGLLAVAFGFIPAELRSIIWLILLIAVILATIRVFLHFFG